MEEINLTHEIERLKANYEYYRSLYRRFRFLFCCKETKTLKEHRDYYKKEYERKLDRSRT